MNNDETKNGEPTPGSRASEYRLNEMPPVDAEIASGPFADLERRTAEYLDRVRASAARIVDDAREEVDALQASALERLARERAALEERSRALEDARRQLEEDATALEERWRALEQETFEDAKRVGRDEGLKEGRADGEREGRKELQKKFDEEVAREAAVRVTASQEAALAPARKLVAELRGTRQALLQNWEENVMQIAAAIAYQTIMREPALARDVPLDLLREALELAMNCATLKIRMNPRDVANLSGAIDALLEETGNLAKSEVVPDPKISIGGCVVETGLGVVDERLESRLERIVAELSEQPQ